jgi:hypothetical protein
MAEILRCLGESPIDGKPFVQHMLQGVADINFRYRTPTSESLTALRQVLSER